MEGETSSVRVSRLLTSSRHSQLRVVVIQVLIILTTSELIKNSLAKSEHGFKSKLSVIHETEEDEDELISDHRHDLGGVIVSPITDTFNGGSFGSFHNLNSGLDTISVVDHHLHQPSQGGCEPIKIGMCMELGYNETTMPNLVGHDAQADADALLQTFTPLIQYGCSPHLKLFLCSSHAPMCTDKTPQPIGPCRSLCESVRRKCEPVLTEFGFKWPPSLECTKFYPENNHQHMCIPGPMDMSHGGGFTFRSPPGSSGNQWTENKPFVHTGSIKNGGIDVVHHAIPANPKISRKPTLTDEPAVVFRRIPPEEKVPMDTVHFIGGTGTSGQRNPINENVEVHMGCGPRKVWSKGTCWKKCPTNHADDGDELFKRSEMEFARNYTLPWAILSLFSALLCLLTVAFRSSKLSTAERPILYIAFSQMLFSLGTIIGTTMSLSCFTDKILGIELLAGKGTVPSSCALTFFLTYFFGLATNLWWVILCLSWMLSVSVNLRISLQKKERSLSHLLTWGTASILTATALIFKKVDADELTGVCGIGFQDAEALTVFLMIPLGIALSLGIACLFFGSISRFFPNWIPSICCFRLNKSQSTTTGASARENHAYSPVLVLPPPQPAFNFNSHHPHYHPNPLDQEDTSPSFFNPQSVNRFQRRRVVEDANAVWIRIGIFSLVNVLPLACQVGAIAYEFLFKESWENGSGHPNLQIFLLRLNMSLIPGLTAGVWVLSTFSWKSFSASCTHSLGFLRPKGLEHKISPAAPGNGTSPSVATTSSPLLIPVPVNSLATTYVTLGGRTCEEHGHGHRPFARIVTPRYHQPPLPPLPARNPEPMNLDGWRRTETIV